jgi:phosphatidylglycerol:prolipoprotein diacylglycerol transferase
MIPTPTPTPGFWVHDLDPVALRFPEGWPLHGIHWYGLAYAGAFILGAWLLARSRRLGLSPLRDAADESTLMTFLMVGVVLGGRLGHVILYARDQFLADPSMILRVWEGGMAFHGGVLGALLGLSWFAQQRGLSVLSVGDLVCACATPGLLLGRLANFVNAELVGRPTDLPWAVVFPWPGGLWTPPVHPSQLYEALLEGALLGVWMLLRQPLRLPPGRLGGEFLLGYAAARFLCEFVRLPEDGYILGLTAGQFWCLPMAIAGIFLILRTRSLPRQPSPR